MADELRPGDAESIIEATIVASERLAARTFGGVPCPGIHGEETPEGFEPPIVAVSYRPCPYCGAVV